MTTELGRVATDAGSIFLLGFAITVIAVEVLKNWSAIRAALSGRHGRRD
jgi:hypothetical protein